MAPGAWKIRLIESMNPEWIDLFEEATGEIPWMVPRTLPVAAVEQKQPAEPCMGPGLVPRAPLARAPLALRRRDDAMWHYATLPLPPR